MAFGVDILGKGKYAVAVVREKYAVAVAFFKSELHNNIALPGGNRAEVHHRSKLC